LKHGFLVKSESGREWYLIKDLEGGDCGLIQVTISAYAWRDWRKPRKMSVRI